MMHLRLDESPASSGTVLIDVSGHGNHGTVVNNDGSADKSVPGVDGNALRFDGAGDRVDATAFDIEDTFTVALWVDFDTTTDRQAFLGKHTASGGNQFVLGYYGGYHVRIRGATFQEGLPQTGWQHIAVVGESTGTATEVTLYRNAIPLWTNTFAAVMGNVAGGLPWTLGQEWDGGPTAGDFLHGEIDDVMVWNGALTASEIETLVLGSTTNRPGPLARALSGTAGSLGPGLDPGVSFSSFSYPVLNGEGQTAFRGRLTGEGVTRTNDLGIWSERGGSGLALVARTGDPAPGTADGVTFIGFASFPVFNGAGQTAFRGGLGGEGVTTASDQGIWSEGGGSGLTLVAREGDAAPGTPAGVVFNSLATSPLLNDVGQTAFWGSLTGEGVNLTNSSGIWSEGGGSGLALVARAGDPAPGTAEGVRFDNTLGSPVLNRSGQIAFRGYLIGTGVDGSNNNGIWSDRGGSGLALIARSGDPAPGAADGANFSWFSILGLNNAGQIAFFSTLAGEEVTDANDSGIWSEGGGSGLVLRARKGSQAPGTAEGVAFAGLGGPTLNGAGQIAFFAILTGAGVTSSNDQGIWSEGGGSGLALVVRSGDPAPGEADGVHFGNLFTPVLDRAGQTAFTATLTGPGVDTTKEGIWATDLDGQLHQVAREGGLLDVSLNPLSPDLRTIASLALLTVSGGEDGLPSAFNHTGQIAFGAEFVDGSSGIFVAAVGGPAGPSFNVTITPAAAPAAGFDLAWDSRPGKVYDVIASDDIATPTAEWPVHPSHRDILATAATTTVTAVPVEGPLRFLAIVEKDAPPAP